MENKRIKLWSHCVSEHAVRFSPEVAISILEEYHKNEHDGPCTIRNHDKNNRSYDLRKMGVILAETE